MALLIPCLALLRRPFGSRGACLRQPALRSSSGQSTPTSGTERTRRQGQPVRYYQRDRSVIPPSSIIRFRGANDGAKRYPFPLARALGLQRESEVRGCPRAPYKEGVPGSNPSATTTLNRCKDRHLSGEPEVRVASVMVRVTARVLPGQPRATRGGSGGRPGSSASAYL